MPDAAFISHSPLHRLRSPYLQYRPSSSHQPFTCSARRPHSRRVINHTLAVCAATLLASAHLNYDVAHLFAAKIHLPVEAVQASPIGTSIHSPSILDDDLDSRAGKNVPKYFDDLDISSGPPQSGKSVSNIPEYSATYEDYLDVIRLPPVDLGQDLREYARTALIVAFPVLSISSFVAYISRTNPRVTLPVVYDVDALQRYFSVRPDVVLSRVLQFAREGTLMLTGVLLDKIATSTDELLVRLKVQSPLWRLKRTHKRSQQRAVALRGAITRLGPAMIKLGQAVASRPDLVSAPIVRELQPLQDDVVAVFPSQQAFEVIRDELGATVQSIFEYIDAEPIAGASLGMVFKAQVDGVPVAVKVQRPEVAASVALDCYIVRIMAQIASAVFGLRTDWRAAVDEYASRLFEELDYTKELDNMTKFREVYANVPGIYLPRAFPKYCSRRVLVTEWVDGVKLIDANARVRQQDLELVETGIRFALMQLLDKGFLHADMHNGNMLRTKSGLLAYIDFGLVSEVPNFVRESLVCALVHLIHGEYSLLAECLAGLELMRPDDVQMELPVLSEALREAFEPMMSATASATAMSDTRGNGVGSGTTVVSTGVRRFRDFTLVGVATKLLLLGTQFPLVFRDYFLNNLRCLGMLEGLALNADPNFNVLSVVYPYVAKKMLTGRSDRYRHALESVVLDSYGRMRWRRIDQLLYDVQATAATSKVDIGGNMLPSSEWMKDTRSYGADLGADRRLGTEEDTKQSAKAVLRFILSDEGRFLRRYVIQQYLFNLEIDWRRSIDRKFGVGDEGVVISPVNVTSPVWRDAAMRWLALQSTARELTDDEARIRTREFFRYTPLLKKAIVLIRLIPGAIMPLFKTLVAIFSYAFIRWWRSLFRRKEVVRVVDESPERDFAEVPVKAAVSDTSGEWSPMESTFARKTREARLVGRQVEVVPIETVSARASGA